MKFDDKDVDWLSALLAEAASVEIMPRWRRLSDTDVRQKTSTIDLVTEADVNAERYITRRLRERYPDALVVGEEAHAEDPSVLPSLGDAQLAFVIDPVDGTLNFAAGLPLFGVMLAVVVNGETVAGIIHDPLGKDFLIGLPGAGAHIRHADGRLERCRVAAPGPANQMSGIASWYMMQEPERSRVARNMARFQAYFNLRCAAHEYRLLATGHGHFVAYVKLMPWDHLAGVLIHKEAGGYAARLDGSAYLPRHVGGGLLAAPDRDSWEEIRRTLWAE
ncbi:MAG: inositol monophosphatase [Rhizobiaceae bacterium]|nr:inositol monophosphatase [Rhizobiaceae bacterium]